MMMRTTTLVMIATTTLGMMNTSSSAFDVDLLYPRNEVWGGI